MSNAFSQNDLEIEVDVGAGKLFGKFYFDEAGDILAFLRAEAFIPGVIAHHVIKMQLLFVSPSSSSRFVRSECTSCEQLGQEKTSNRRLSAIMS